jgi:hypothetical protein
MKLKIVNKFNHLIGKRIELISTSDAYTNLEPGDKGVVECIDDTGTIFVIWDRGSTLGMIPGEDMYRFLD